MEGSHTSTLLRAIVGQGGDVLAAAAVAACISCSISAAVTLICFLCGARSSFDELLLLLLLDPVTPVCLDASSPDASSPAAESNTKNHITCYNTPMFKAAVKF